MSKDALVHMLELPEHHGHVAMLWNTVEFMKKKRSAVDIPLIQQPKAKKRLIQTTLPCSSMDGFVEEPWTYRKLGLYYPNARDSGRHTIFQ